MKINELDLYKENSGLSEERKKERKKLFSELKKVSYRQEALDKQRARNNWINLGDSNTKIFHSIMNWRRSKNKITGLNI